jgi:hypothetical protein
MLGCMADQIATAGVFDDELRAEQAAASLKIWGRSNRELHLGPPCVVALRPSGSMSLHRLNRLHGRSGAVGGLVFGAVLFGLPAAGAAALIGWVLGNVVFGLAGLIGIVSDSGTLVTLSTFAIAALAALVAGLLGGALGLLIGWLAGLIANRVRGWTSPQVALVRSRLTPGTAAVLLRAPAESAPAVTSELARLGGAPRPDLLAPVASTPTTPERPAGTG